MERDEQRLVWQQAARAYREILEQYSETGEEEYLLRASDLASCLVEAELGPEDVVELHLSALEQARLSCVATSPRECSKILLLPLLEILVSYGAAFRSWINQQRLVEQELRQAQAESEEELRRRNAELAVVNRRLRSQIKKRRKLERRLRRSRRRLLQAQRIARLGFWVYHRQLKHMRCSRELLSILGRSSGQIATMDEYLEAVYPDDQTFVRETFTRLFSGMQAEGCEYRICRPEGQIRTVRQEAIVDRHPGREDEEFVVMGTVLDVTEMKHAEAAVRRAERLASLGTLAAGIAHEINNPVGAALLAAETALAVLERQLDRDILRQCLENIAASMERCGRLIEGVLMFSRQRRGRKQQCDLNQVAITSKAMLQPVVRQRGAKVELRLSEQPLWVWGCRLELELAVTNLLRNAVESRSSGVNVLVQTEVQEQTAVLRIRDDGRGMNKQQLAHLFDLFCTSRSHSGGTGLGASMALDIVREHGGEIDVTSSPGKGTTVTVRLPVHTA